jgi:hypothetical protein
MSWGGSQYHLHNAILTSRINVCFVIKRILYQNTGNAGMTLHWGAFLQSMLQWKMSFTYSESVAFVVIMYPAGRYSCRLVCGRVTPMHLGLMQALFTPLLVPSVNSRGAPRHASTESSINEDRRSGEKWPTLFLPVTQLPCNHRVL